MRQRRVGKLRSEFNQTVLINQTQFDSQYFRLDDIPAHLTSGKNIFKLYGNNQLLKAGTQIMIQVTNINGTPVYHHVNNYVDPTGRLVVGIWVYPETPPGLGKLEIIGIATHREDGRPVPSNWRDKYNVKWSREITINPSAINKTPILFQQVPGLKIFEYEREYLTQTYISGTSIASQSTGAITYAYSGWGSAYITIEGANFSASMAGGLLTVPVPGVVLPAGYTTQTNAVTEYTTYIDDIINSTTLRADPYTLAIVSTDEPVSYEGKANAPPISTVDGSFPVTSFGPITDYTIEWQQEAVYATGSQNSQSFASVTLKNLDPIAGNVHSIKTHMRSHGYADYQVVSEDILQERDLLINVNSDLAYDRVGDFKSQEIINNYWTSESVNQPGYPPICIHDDSQMISSMLISGSTSLSASSNYPATPLPSDAYIKVVSNPNIEIYKGNEYQVKFKVVAEADPITQVKSSLMDIYISGSGIGASDDRNIGYKLVTLESTNTAPSLITNVAEFLNIADLVNSAAPVNAPAISNVPAFPGFVSTQTVMPAAFLSNTVETANPVVAQNIDERLLEVSYTPSADTDAHIVFAVTRGKWYLSNVQLEGANDYGFTPNHTFLEFPIQTPQADDILDFKFEFYNASGDVANITLTTQSMDFVGSNLFISGDGNQLSGSIIVGDGIIMQGFN